MDEEWKRILRSPPYFPKKANLVRYDYVTRFLDAALFLGDHRAHVFLSMKEVFYFHNVVCKSASVKQTLQSEMFEGNGAVKNVWGHEEKMSSEVIGDVYFM